jgi:hypothetical protein
MYLTVQTKEGRGLVVCRHHGDWFLGITRDRGKGRETRFTKQESLEDCLEKASRLEKVWRGRQFGLHYQHIH